MGCIRGKRIVVAHSNTSVDAVEGIREIPGDAVDLNHIDESGV
jgi:hypothetical protein